MGCVCRGTISCPTHLFVLFFSFFLELFLVGGLWSIGLKSCRQAWGLSKRSVRGSRSKSENKQADCTSEGKKKCLCQVGQVLSVTLRANVEASSNATGLLFFLTPRDWEDKLYV